MASIIFVSLNKLIKNDIIIIKVKFMRKIKSLFILFYNFFKIGAFTFGGGLAMIPLISKIVVDKYHWMSEEEFVDTIAICESTPGPIAINMATYVGYKNKKFLGSLFATLGVALPSFIIILIISFFFEDSLTNEYFFAAITGIKVCVIFLVLKAGVKMLKLVNKKVIPIAVLVLTIIASLIIELYHFLFQMRMNNQFHELHLTLMK